MTKELITVEVAYATPSKQKIIKLKVQAKTSLAEIVKKSNIAKIFTEINLENLELGVFGKRKPNDSFAENFDRIEIYRSLKIDPKKSRMAKAKEAK